MSIPPDGWSILRMLREPIFFAPVIEDSANLLVPAISLYEVYKRLFQQRGRQAALRASACMQLGELIPLDEVLAIEAAEFSANHKIPMADSIIYVSARSRKAELWTQDVDLQGLTGVQFQPKQ